MNTNMKDVIYTSHEPFIDTIKTNKQTNTHTYTWLVAIHMENVLGKSVQLETLYSVHGKLNIRLRLE